MKRLRSSDDLDSYNEKLASKESNLNRSSSSHRRFYYKSDNARKNLMSSSSSSGRYDRSGVDDNRPIRKRSDHDFDGFDRRKGFDRYSSTSRDGYSGGGGDGDRVIHRSKSFSVPRRGFPKGFRSERDSSRREGSVSSWRRFGCGARGSDSKEFSAGSKEVEEKGGGTSGVRSPMGSRDMLKSPSWSRDSGSDQSKARGVWKEKGSERERERVKERSPTWSKDSGSEQQSRSVELKKTEVEWKGDRGSGSEIEEGELEPEPKSSLQVRTDDENDNEVKVKKDDGLDADPSEAEDVQSELRVEETNKTVEGVEEESKEGDALKMKGMADDCDKVNEFERNLHHGSDGGHDEIGIATTDAKEQEKVEDSLKEINECKAEENLKKSSDCLEETRKDTVADRSFDMEVESKQDKGIDLEVEVEVEDVEMLNSNEGNATELVVNTDIASEGSEQNVKDKGKRVAVTPPVVDYVGMTNESRDAVPCMDDDREGPSTRGFELFSSSPVRRAEKADSAADVKQKVDKLTLESLDLSLSLPNVLLPIGASRDTNAAPSSPSNTRSVQSLTNTFRTNSDGFTASMSFSGSQSLYHNPSCSLTQNSLDNYEQSVHSHPIFQGIDQLSQGAWQGPSQNDSRYKEVPLYQRILMTGNGSHQQSQTSQGISNGQPGQGSSKMPNGLERRLSFHKQLSGGQAKYQDDVKSPSHSFGSHEIGSNYSFEKKRSVREKHSGILYRTSSQKEQEQFLIGGTAFVETIMSRMVSEPVHLMARKFHEMKVQSVSCLKESIREIIFSAEKHEQLHAVQNALQNRSDLTLDMLLKCHRAQLEILVALKTGLPEYLQLDSGVSSSDIAEIFLNLKCRNLTCRNALPVDECDCKVCVRKDGFCSACMCLICSKFDMASNTCSWVGCDVCLHWCHADCALRESFIRNGWSATGAQGTTEMQFHCVACDHPSEMFGFVKEVFINFSKDWTVETFCKELECVKRIFRGSKDVRGKRLNEIAHQILARLAANKSDLPEVYRHIMSFLTETDSSKFKDTTCSLQEQGQASNGIAMPSQESAWLKSVHMEKAPQLERSGSLIHSHRDDRNGKRPLESELMRSTQKEPVFDELESIVRVKQAEAKMFQARADDARRESEGLKRIAIAKNEKIEEEYSSRIAKLRVAESEEMRKQKFEEFQALERAHREYFNMKMRMEADIKDLLLKMEATKRNFTM